jgi:hypothetical protein
MTHPGAQGFLGLAGAQGLAGFFAGAQGLAGFLAGAQGLSDSHFAAGAHGLLDLHFSSGAASRRGRQGAHGLDCATAPDTAAKAGTTLAAITAQ